jgi:hypothetical protein
MPRGDGTGPAGMGPMTGRAAGYCAGYNVPGFMNPYGGRFAGGMPLGAGRYPYPAYGGGAYPAYGAFRFPGRGFGLGRGRAGYGRGRGGFARGRGGW